MRNMSILKQQNGTSFAKRHPYLLWQIIGWSILLADAVFFVVAALQDFGEWCYPVIVFPFIGTVRGDRFAVPHLFLT